MSNSIRDFLRSMDELSIGTESIIASDSEGTVAEESLNREELTEADEAVIVLEAILEESTPKEFANILEAAQEMAIYGLIPDTAVESLQQFAKELTEGKTESLSALESTILSEGEPATEAQKKIVVQDWKGANMTRIHKRTCIRMAARDKYAAYAKYIKCRKGMIEAREDIYKKYNTAAKAETKKIMQNAKRKSSNMGGATGAALTKKLNAQIAKHEG